MDIKKIIALRVGLALVSSGILAFLSQIAVFVYTRSLNAPIPAGEIIGLSGTAVGLILGLVWAAALLFLLLIRNGWSLFSHLNTHDDLSALEPRYLSRGVLFWWGVLPILGAITFSIFLVFCTSCTAKMLNILGYGGGINCVYIINGVQASSSNLILLSGDTAYLTITRTIDIKKHGTPRIGYTRKRVTDIDLSCMY